MESIEEIYRNHSKKVYMFLLSKTCDHDLAEELTQETFFCAVSNIGKFKGNSSILTWLCGIAQNLWLKYLRLIGEISFAQIGEIMGRSENWARVNFYRGKKRLIEEMEKNE